MKSTGDFILVMFFPYHLISQYIEQDFQFLIQFEWEVMRRTLVLVEKKREPSGQYSAPLLISLCARECD